MLNKTRLYGDVFNYICTESKRNRLVQGVVDDDHGENGSDEEGHDRGKDKKEKEAKQEAKGFPLI